MADRRIFVSGDLTSDEKFKEAMEQIKGKGFIPSHRAGDTGVGRTLEDELGVEENSVQAADLGKNDRGIKIGRSSRRYQTWHPCFWKTKGKAARQRDSDPGLL